MTQLDPQAPAAADPQAPQAPLGPPAARAAGRPPTKRRSVGNVKAAASLLLKEGRKILKKYEPRIAAAPVAAIRGSMDELERLRALRQWEPLEDECERLDELLHQHAAFARKSPLRETLENISIAVAVALALRSCLYEPFKIPSGSMMPTLRSGDHIFVNKFAYGIQIPFTTTVVGDFLGSPRRGDVIVFRYPVDESEDFIKRVIGLPGDTVRVEGNKVSIKRPGEAEFTAIERTKLDEKCLDDAAQNPVPHCTVYEEHLDGHSYTVRYRSSSDPRTGQRRFGEWSVPAGHFLVMGDNRNESHDSLAWTKQVEAVAADGLLSVKDLRDLTPEKLFTLVRPDDTTAREDSSYDHIVYMADHASDAHGLQLEVWRDPVLGHAAIYETLAQRLEATGPTANDEGAAAGIVAAGIVAPRRTSFGELFAADPRINSPGNKPVADRLRSVGEGIGEVAYQRDELAYTAAIHLVNARAVLELRCGVAVCSNLGALAEQIGNVVEKFDRDRSLDARQLLEGERTVRYSQHWTSRGPSSDKFVQRSYQPANQRGEPGANAVVRLRAWRAPDEPEDVLRDAALRAAGSSRTAARQVVDEAGEDAWLASDEQKFTFVRVDAASQVVFALECGRQRCASDTDMLTLVRGVQSRVPAASKDRSRMPELLAPTDLPGWKEQPAPPSPERHEYDRLRLDGTIRDAAYSVNLWVWRHPGEGLDAKLKALVAAIPNAKPDEQVASGGFMGKAESGGGSQFVFAVPTTDSVIRLECSPGLCAGPDEARKLALRAANKAQDLGNFVDPNADRPRPYVPRGNVKGRAERIWLPLSRFWRAIR